MASWEDLPDLEEAPAAKAERASWEDLPDVPEPPKPSNLVKLMAFIRGEANPYAPAGSKRVTFDPDEEQAAREHTQRYFDTVDANTKEKGLKAALSFVSGGGPLTDELAGVQEAAKSGARTLTETGFAEDPLTAYRRGRDSARTEIDQATRDASPTVDLPVLGETPVLPLAGAVASTLPVPGAATWAQRLAAGGFTGGLSALSGSQADLTRGDPKQVRRALVDTALGTGAGIAAAGVAEAPRALGNLGGKMVQSGKLAQLEKSQRLAAKETAQTAQKASTISADFTKGVEWLLDVVRNPNNFSPDEVALAHQRLADPAVRAEAQQFLGRILNDLPAKATARETARAAASEAARTEGQRAAEAAAQRMENPYTNLFKDRMVRAAYRSGTAAVDAASGAASGGVLPSSPFSVTMWMNAAKDPLARIAAGGTLQKYFSPVGNSGTAAAAGAAEAVSSASQLSDEEREAIDAFIGAP